MLVQNIKITKEDTAGVYGNDGIADLLESRIKASAAKRWLPLLFCFGFWFWVRVFVLLC